MTLYYYKNNYNIPIKLLIDERNNVIASSSYWNDEYGIKNDNKIKFNNFGIAIIYDDYIKFDNNNCWHKDNRKNLLFIGANDMAEIENYTNQYNNGLFIEAIPKTFERLKKNLSKIKSSNINYIPLNKLVTSVKDKEYTFYIFNNNEASSSIYTPNYKLWVWDTVNIKETQKLISTTVEDILIKQQWEYMKYDVVLDVQGAELEVLKGFGENNFKNINKLTIEISNIEYYNGGVLFEELNNYLINNNFILTEKPKSSHCDVVYIPKPTFSQINQDLAVLTYYNNKKNGYFVEIGASNGITLSNTYLLETTYNWKGICVEPIPKMFNELVINRPNSKCYNMAVYNMSNTMLNFDIANNNTLLSGISTHIDKHKNIVDDNKKTIIVNTITINDMLDNASAPNIIEYLSLDTEGSEYEILKELNFNKYHFGLIDVEHNFIEPRRTNIRNLLTSHGYVFLKENQFDDCYRHSNWYNL